MSDPGVITLTRQIPAATASVWAALTDPSLVARWWATGDVRPIVGHEFTLDMGPFGQQRCEVLEVQPESRFVFKFGVDKLGTTVSWALDAVDGGTLLSFEHAGFDLDSPLGQTAFQGMRAGWPSILARLEAVIVAE